MFPEEIKRLRLQHRISLIELAGYTGLPSGLIGQIEDKSVPALQSDLDRIETVLKQLIGERERES